MNKFEGFQPKGTDGAQISSGQRLNPDEGYRQSQSVNPYVPPVDERKGRCISNDDTCLGFRAKGTQHCIGHLRQIAAKQKAELKWGANE